MFAGIFRRSRVARLEVFGSVARGEGRLDRDVELLCALADGARLCWEIQDLADELSPVDLVSLRALHERLRKAVLAEARPLYANGFL